MKMKWSKALFVVVALGIAVLTYIYDSPSKSEPVRVNSGQNVENPASEGYSIGESAPSSLSTALSIGKSYQSPAGEQSSDLDPEQRNQIEAAASGGQYSDSDSNDYYGEELFKNWELALNDSDSEVRRLATENVIALRNDAAFEILSEAFQDREARNRVAAIDSLGRLLSEGVADEEQILGLLLEATEDIDPDVAQAAKLLVQERFKSLTESTLITGRLYADEQPPKLDSEQDLNSAAASGDQYIDSDSNDYYREELIEDLEIDLNDSDSEVRREAAENAVALRNDAAFEFLSEALQDREAQNRAAAIDSLGRLLSEGAADEEQILILLLEATNDLDPDVARTAKLLVQDRFSSQIPFSFEKEY